MRQSTLISTAAAMICAGLCTPVSEAQDAAAQWVHRSEVFANIGHAAFYNGGNPWGGGTEIGVGVGVRLAPGRLQRLGVEALLLHSEHSLRSGSAHQTTGSQTSFAVNGVYHFSASRVQPFVYGGIGAMSADFALNGLSDWYDDSGHHTEATVQRVSAGKLLMDVGAGLKIHAGRRLVVRPELRMLSTTPGSGWNFAHLAISVGVGYSF
jgi:hypothetical protein